MGSPGLIQLGAVDLKSQNVRTAGVCSQRDGIAALRGCNNHTMSCPGLLVSYTASLTPPGPGTHFSALAA